MTEIIRSDQTQFKPGSMTPSDARGGAASVGQYRGERVTQGQSEAGRLQDAAEELTFQMGEEGEKSLAKRKVRAKRSRAAGAGFDAVQQVRDKLGDLRKNDLERVLRILLKLRDASPGALRHLLREQLPEPSHQYAALLSHLEQLRADGADHERVRAAEKALSQLEQDEGPAIRAALNIAEVAANFADEQLGELAELRDRYRATVMSEASLQDNFESLLEHYGGDQLSDAIGFLMKATSADLGADGSSIDRIKLQAALNDLYRLELLAGLRQDCQQLVERHGPVATGDSPRRLADDLLRHLLRLVDSRWLTADNLDPVTAEMNLGDLRAEIAFLHAFKDLCRLIPLKAYADPDQRSRLLGVVQEVMDVVIAREEEEEV